LTDTQNCLLVFRHFESTYITVLSLKKHLIQECRMTKVQMLIHITYRAQ